ncbi:hypothetical protein [Escherichia fergusonii]
MIFFAGLMIYSAAFTFVIATFRGK